MSNSRLLRATAALFVCATCPLLAVPRSHAAWESLGPDSPAEAYSLVVDPTDPDVAYVGGSSGVYRSGDGGTTWVPVHEGLRRGVNDLEIDPNQPATLYAAGWYGANVYKTTSSGATWFASPESLLFGVNDLSTDPRHSGTVYAAAYGIAKTIDGGQSWTQAYESIQTEEETEYLCSVIVDPSAPDTVYASSSFGGIVRTTDGGTSWERVGGASLGQACSNGKLAVAPSSEGTLYVARAFEVLRSVDGGASWSIGAGLPDGPNALAVDPTDPDVVFVATDSQLLRSSDGGVSFEALPGNWSLFTIHALAIAPSNPQVIYAATDGGVFHSSDGGSTWKGSFNGMRGQTATALSVDPTSPGTLFVAFEANLLRKSTDGGESWSVVGRNGLRGVYVYDVAVDPKRPNVVYAGRFSALADGGGVSKSTDGGKTFQLARDGLPLDSFHPTRFASVVRVAIDPDQTDRIYAASWGGGVYRTTDGAAHWSPMNEGLGGYVFLDAIALDPRTKTLYASGRAAAARGNALLKRAPTDASWHVIATDFGGGSASRAEVFAIALDPNDSDTIYAGTNYAGVFKSVDAGETWLPASAGLAASPVVNLIVDPAHSPTVFAETLDGVFRSDNGATSWTDFSAGLFPLRIGDQVYGTLALDSSGLGALYTGTQGGGSYRYRLPCDQTEILRPRITVANLTGTPGDQQIDVDGTIELATGRRIVPGAVGLRLRLEDAGGTSVLDVNLPGGPGWRSGPQGNLWRFTADVPGHGRWRATLHQNGRKMTVRVRGARLDLNTVASQPPSSMTLGLATNGIDRTCGTSPHPLECTTERGDRRLRCR